MKTIAHITDIHLDEGFPQEQGVDQRKNWELLLNDLKTRKVEQVVFGGDIGTPSSHEHFFSSLQSYELHLSLGNHDSYKEVLKSISGDTAPDGLYKFFEDDAYRYIFLDSSTEAISDQQLSWFTEAIKTTKKLLVFVHHPILTVPSFVDNGYALKGREKLKDLLFSSPSEVTIVCGHYHFEDERSEKNIRQMVTPAASYQLKKSDKLIIENSEFGYRLLHISPEIISSDVIFLKSDKSTTN